MDNVAMKQALAGAVGRPPTDDPAMGGWVYLPGEHSRACRLLDAGEALSRILADGRFVAVDAGAADALREWESASAHWRAGL